MLRIRCTDRHVWDGRCVQNRFCLMLPLIPVPGKHVGHAAVAFSKSTAKEHFFLFFVCHNKFFSYVTALQLLLLSHGPW